MDEEPVFVKNPKPNLSADDPLFVLNPLFDSADNRRSYGVETREEQALKKQQEQQQQMYGAPVNQQVQLYNPQIAQQQQQQPQQQQPQQQQPQQQLQVYNPQVVQQQQIQQQQIQQQQQQQQQQLQQQQLQAYAVAQKNRLLTGVYGSFYDESRGPAHTVPGMQPGIVYGNPSNYSDHGNTMLMTDWMRALPDNAPLAALSIPGSHDSMATKGGPVVQRQSWDIATQLRTGIRYFDLKLSMTQTGLAYNHGPGVPPSPISDFLQPVNVFLEQHPRETVLVRVKDICNGNLQFYNRLHILLNQQYPNLILPLTATSVLLGQARGRVVIVKDYYGGPAGGVEFTQQDFTEAVRLQNPDMKSIKPLTDIVKSHLRRAMKSMDFSRLFITDTSAIGPGYPCQYAPLVNEKMLLFYQKYPKGRVGIIAMDFPSEKLVYSIVQRNFWQKK